MERKNNFSSWTLHSHLPQILERRWDRQTQPGSFPTAFGGQLWVQGAPERRKQGFSESLRWESRVHGKPREDQGAYSDLWEGKERRWWDGRVCKGNGLEDSLQFASADLTLISILNISGVPLDFCLYIKNILRPSEAGGLRGRAKIPQCKYWVRDTIQMWSINHYFESIRQELKEETSYPNRGDHSEIKFKSSDAKF